MPFLRGCNPFSACHRLAGAIPHTAVQPTPLKSGSGIPKKISMWGNDTYGDCVTAEEAFAKACHEPEIFVPDTTVINWAAKNDALNGAELTQVMDLMRTGGFSVDGTVFDDGPASSVDWTNEEILRNAISLGPVKIGIAADQLQSVVPDPPKDGWFATKFAEDRNEDHCTSLCGFGTIGWLAYHLGSVFPEGADGGEMALYAMFTWDLLSYGIIDYPSLKSYLRGSVAYQKSHHG